MAKTKTQTVTDSTNLETVLTYGEAGAYSIALADLPPAVIATLAQRTFSHIMGNEASAVRLRHAAMTNEDGTAKYGDAELAVIEHDWRMAKIAAMREGAFSLRVVGPKLSSDERFLREFARDAIVMRAKAKGKALPKASDGAAWDAMIDQYLASPALLAGAQSALAARKAALLPDANDVLEAAGF